MLGHTNRNCGLLAACGVPQDVNNSEKSDGIVIEATAIKDAEGNCTGRTDKTNLAVGQMVVLGEYNNQDGGWKVEIVSQDTLRLTETTENAITSVNEALTPGFKIEDMKHDAPELITLPSRNEDALTGDRPLTIARYVLRSGGFFRSGGSGGRGDETGQIALMNNSERQGFTVSISSTFTGNQIGAACP